LTKMKRAKTDQPAAENVAIQALSYLAEEPERLARFMALSGLESGDIRAAAAEAGFLAGVLDHVTSDEALLVAFASSAGLAPADVERAHAALTRGERQRDIP
jgi:hypothetical protein